MSRRDYLTVADVLGMHAILIQRYGGSPGLRDAGALESAVFRPQTGDHADMMQMFDLGTFDLASLEPWLRQFVEQED